MSTTFPTEWAAAQAFAAPVVAAKDAERDRTMRMQAEGDPMYGGEDLAAKATGATAGIPGAWTPAGSTPRSGVTDMAGVTATPATAWTTGQFVQGSTAGAAGRVTWTGSAWVGGIAP